MKIKSYETMTNKSISEVKVYLYIIGQGRYQEQLYSLMATAIDVAMIKKRLAKQKHLQLWLFTLIKKRIDEAKNYETIEKHLIYLNVLFNNDFPPVKDYQYRLFQYIISTGFDIEKYCLLRHLFLFHSRYLDDYIHYICKKTQINDDQYHYYAAYVLLLEKEYKQAYRHLYLIEWSSSLDRFKEALYNDNPFRYYHLTKQTSKELREVYSL